MGLVITNIRQCPNALSINAGEPPEGMAESLVAICPKCSEQNPVEDIWLFAKRFIRSCYYLFNSFDMVKSLC
jgi:hypothetical protein